MGISEYKSERYGTVFGAAAADYLTLTTFEAGAFFEVKALVSEDEKAIEDRFRGYIGVRYGQLRFLSGEQHGRDHYIIIAEGSSSEWLLEVVREAQVVSQGTNLYEYFNCTRIDVQVSARDDWTHFRTLKDGISNPLGPWNRRGKRPKVSLIEGDKTSKGLGKTIYVGSSKVKNGYFVRMYEKEDGEGLRWLRFEAQLKGKVAGKAFADLCEQVVKPVDIVRTILDTYPTNIRNGHLSHIAEACENGKAVRLRAKVLPTSDVKRALWFKYDVAPALMKIEESDTSFWLEKELIKAAFVLQNRRKRRGRQEAEARAQAIWRLSPSASDALKARRAQEDATASLIEEEGKERPELVGGQLPEQGTLFSVDEWERLLDAVLDTSYHDYR